MNEIDFIKKCIEIIKKKTSRNILSGIGELLSTEKKKWIKENLISDTVFLLENIIKQY